MLAFRLARLARQIGPAAGMLVVASSACSDSKVGCSDGFCFDPKRARARSFFNIRAGVTTCEEKPKISSECSEDAIISKSYLRTPTAEEFRAFDTYIFDCDGVIWGIPDKDTQTSVATINYLIGIGKRVMFVTNNSNKSREKFLVELQRKGVFGGRTDKEKLHMMVSASYTTARYLKESGLRRPYVITSDTGILEELKLAGITQYFATVREDGTIPPEFQTVQMQGGAPGSEFAEIEDIMRAHPSVDCVVVGWDMGLTARKVAVAINYLKCHEDIYGDRLGYRSMPIIACSGDSGGVLGTFKFEGQTLKLRAIGNGAMADIIARSFDPPKEWIDMGKPSDALLWLMRNPMAYNVDLSRALMVGDTLSTDIMFGNRGGMQTLLVLSGVTTEKDLVGLRAGGHPMQRPTFVLPTLGSLYTEGSLQK